MGAAFMADSTARIHSTLGVCCSTSGGGMMNLAVGVAESYNDSVPVLAIVGQPPRALEGRGAFQDSSGRGRSVDALKLWESITKYSARINSADDFWNKLEEAVVTALSGRPGPAALLIPRDINETEVGPPPQSVLDLLSNRPTLVPRFENVLQLHQMIRTAKKPVILIGSGMRRSTRPQAAVDYAIKANIPVMTTMADPGAFPNNHPLYMGMVGVAGHPSAHNYLNKEADLIIAVGTGFNIMARAPIAEGLKRAQVAVINVDIENILTKLEPEIALKADGAAVFHSLLARWRTAPFKAPAVLDYALTCFTPVLDDESKKLASQYKNNRVLLQSEALSILQSYLPENGHMLFDAGNCAASSLHYLTVPKGTSTTIALGMGGMGYSIPAAVGAQLSSNNESQSVVICGDGAFLMLGLEVHTAIELGLNILFVVFNNNKHGMCTTRQQLFFEGRMEATEYPEIQVSQIAKGLGSPEQVWTAKVSSASQMHLALEDFNNLATKRPGVLELELPLEEIPPFTTFLSPDAETYSLAISEEAAA